MLNSLYSEGCLQKGVFLDIKSDGYDPNAHDYKLKASIPHLNDPVHSAQKRLIHEDIVS